MRILMTDQEKFLTNLKKGDILEYHDSELRIEIMTPPSESFKYKKNRLHGKVVQSTLYFKIGHESTGFTALHCDWKKINYMKSPLWRKLEGIK